jgi:trans-2,3-dihydro-3-hydroxyanthranilate isomerase
MKLTIVDVFAEAPLEGNQLAVVQDAEDLDAQTMQRFAIEMNFSETTFVTREAPGRARARIFTPAEEIPFAGHPTIGTAWVVSGGRGIVTLELGIGDVEVEVDDGPVWMTAPAGKVLEPLSAEVAAPLVGLDAKYVDVELGAQVIECGLRYWFVGVRDLDALRRVQVRLDGRTDTAVFAVCRGSYSADGDFAARMIFSDGLRDREDAATGSANAAFGALLQQRRERGRFVVEQGFEIDRPSRIYLDVGEQVRVGGRVKAVAEGRLSPALLSVPR